MDRGIRPRLALRDRRFVANPIVSAAPGGEMSDRQGIARFPRDAGRSPMCSRCVCREQSGTAATHTGGGCLCSIQTFSIVIHDAPASPGGAQACATVAVAVGLVAPRGGSARSEQIRSGRLSAEGGTSARTAAGASSQSERVSSARGSRSRSRLDCSISSALADRRPVEVSRHAVRRALLLVRRLRRCAAVADRPGG
jgi:hypothetical protein